MRALRQRSLILLLSAGLAADVYAREPPEARSMPRPDDRTLHFEHLTTEQGLSQGRVTGIVQDRQGFIRGTVVGATAFLLIALIVSLALRTAYAKLFSQSVTLYMPSPHIHHERAGP